MQIYFIRHAQSTNNELYDQNGSGFGRSEDPEITKKGEKQIQHLVDFFSRNKNTQPSNEDKDYQNRSGFFFTHLYASPMIRAATTGWAVAQQYQLPLHLWIDLHEGGGIFLDPITGEPEILSGNSSDYFEHTFPGIVIDAGISPLGWWNKPFEPYEVRPTRATRVWNRLLSVHGPQDKIALFSHGGFYNYLLAVIFGFGSHEFAFFDLNNCGITRVDFDERKKKTNILYSNKVNFLPDDLIT